MNLAGLKVALVGPLPPPAGGMANQTRQLAELLQREGVEVTIVQVNRAYRPSVVGRIRGVRALFRLVPYAVQLWRVADRVDLVHVMANSGWSWHLFAVPAIWIARTRGITVLVNYRGGDAASFLARAGASVRRTLGWANALVVPSGFLQRIFDRHGIASEVVPNIVDLDRFHPAEAAARPLVAHLVVARNLEPIYDIATGLRAFALVRHAVPDARLTVAGSGPELGTLRSLSMELGVAGAVDFCGALDREQMAALYRKATVVLNPSRVDNMPNSVLEAMATGVPVVSTNVGGVPFVLRDGVTGLLVAPGDPAAMAKAVERLLADGNLAAQIRDAALRDVQQYAWRCVRQRWIDVYAVARLGTRAAARPA